MNRRQLLRATAALGLAAAVPAALAQPAATRNRVVIQVSDNDPAKWNLALNNARNLQADLGASNVDVEIVAYGPGIGMLKSDSVAVTATDSSGQQVKVDVPAISGVVGVNVAVGTATDGSATLTYKGKEAVTFGFKAFEIIYANGRWTVAGVQPAAAMAFAAEAGGPTGPVGVVFNAGGLVRL